MLAVESFRGPVTDEDNAIPMLRNNRAMPWPKLTKLTCSMANSTSSI